MIVWAIVHSNHTLVMLEFVPIMHDYVEICRHASRI